MGYEFVSFIRYLRKLPQHLRIVLLRIPSQNRYLFFTLPLVCDTNHLSLKDDRVMIDVLFEPCREGEYDVRTYFDVPKETAYPKLWGFLGYHRSVFSRGVDSNISILSTL